MASLSADGSEWAVQTLDVLRQRSPLLLAVTLEQIRRARSMALEDVLRMERNLIRHAMLPRDGLPSDAVEGIRAHTIDKDRKPRWNPARIEDLSLERVSAFFASPWPLHAHPLTHFL